MPTLSITRGPQGSGKTKLARRLAASEPNTVRLSRDAFREMCYGQSGILSPKQENLITAMMRAAAVAALHGGANPVIDATHGPLRHARAWANLAHAHGAAFRCLDVTATEQQCIANVESRVAAGGHHVPVEAIQAWFKRFPPPWPEVKADFAQLKIERYKPDTTLPDAVIVDMDGTLADNSWRGPYDWEHVISDPLMPTTRRIVNALVENDARLTVIVVSGRPDLCMDDTERWLDRKEIAWDELHMRETGDNRPDNVVKYEIFDREIRPRFNVIGVFDDRLQVVRMWHELGLNVYRVGDPDADF
ncbi:AAA family ATPase [Nocardia sp. NPDC050435]|uniref:phosphatase domain-containing protein n=1 Tax=Nocardia sp. NPDC050435 TaxID=3155040 RepID=UPI0034089FB7